VYADEATWGAAVAKSSVRLQWDPDHDPHGMRQGRRAIQLGLRDESLQKLASEWLIDIEDISQFVNEQRTNLANSAPIMTPIENVIHLKDLVVARRVGID